MPKPAPGNVTEAFKRRLNDDGLVKVEKMPDGMESPFSEADYEDQPFDFGDGDIYTDPVLHKLPGK
jgi:hypothetical protein